MISTTDREVSRIRELTGKRRHDEALAAAEALPDALQASVDVLYLTAVNRRYLNRISDALETLRRLEQQDPRFSRLYQERGHCYTTLGDATRAIEAFRQAVNINPALPTSWHMLERLYRMTGNLKSANAAAVATQRLARLDYARALIDVQKYLSAREELDTLLQLEPDNRDFLSLYATACAGLGDHKTAITVYGQLLLATPEAAELHLLVAHSLKTLGRRREAIESYEAAVAARPSFGDAYWSLANLKTYRFSASDLERMRAAETAPGTGPVDRYHLCFALGNACEARGDYAESWRYYERGNALKHARSRYRPEFMETNTRRQIEVCTAEFFSARTGLGVPDADPIFIVGLPRSGSTLIEQILASHSRVEATHELFDIPRIVLELQGSPPDADDPRYPGVLAELTAEDFRKLGERYMTDTRAYRGGKAAGRIVRGAGAAYFIDKMPNNFRHVGLIHLLLPNAKIIDVRREPLACCFSNFKQLFAGGQEFTYNMENIARYYRTYLDLMRHWD
ncbi:MAG TPA: sulfotransferase, partial [Steroidobacteraceae bacterium]